LDTPSISIVGGGASGALTAMALARRGLDVTVFSNSDLWQGIAYRTTNENHVLNVPAARMSAYADIQDDFISYVLECGFGNSRDDVADVFLPRKLFAQYLASRIANYELAGLIRVVNGEVTTISEDGRSVSLSDGTCFESEFVILCVGDGPPRSLTVEGVWDRIVNDAWKYDDVEQITPNEEVLIVGSGLTAVDVILSLEARGHRGKITAISRRGHLPHHHQPATCEPIHGITATTTSGVVRQMRELVEEVKDWRCAIDSVRPNTVEIWRKLSVTEQKRFFRHVDSYWNIHRHRMAPNVGHKIENLVARNQLEVLRGRPDLISGASTGVEVTLRPQQGRGWDGVRKFGWAVNATGGCDAIVTQRGLIKNLISEGRVRHHDNGVGLDIDTEGRVRDVNGTVNQSLFVVGPLRRGSELECTAIPEIRIQAYRLAALIDECRSPAKVEIPKPEK
jgi:uncharacterized NAD(P)/FAD-binding protein YdhS